jgi:tRNA(Ile)-lysidine synthase
MRVELKPGTYVVAVSGGVDSVGLLHMLREQRGVKLIVAHFDHGIRDDSRLDKQLVQQMAADYNLPFVYDEGNLGKGASEAAAREARYKFLRRVRDLSHANAIITAHHQDDALETAIINWLRGTGRRGYTALKSDHELLRPLLNVPKQELINYAKRNGLRWHEDSTNKQTNYLRNLIRHKVMPQLTAQQRADMVAALHDLRGLNDKIDEKLVHFLHTQPKLQHIDRHWFIMLPHDVALELMAMWLRLNHCQFDRKLLERLVASAKTLAAGKAVDIDKTHVIEVKSRQLALVHRER